MKFINLKEERSEKGFILLVSYLLLAALSTFSLGMFNWGLTNIQSSERNKKKIVAFNMAEAGFDQAYYNVKNGVITSFPHTGSYTSMNSGSVEGGYAITVTDMGSGIKKIVATGYSPAAQSTSQRVESRSVTGYIQTANTSAFLYGVFAKNSIALSGNAYTDAYNSDNGSYGGSNTFSRGDMGTDSASNGTVTLSGNAQIRGDVTTGVGSTPTSVITTSGNANVTGSKTAATASLNPQAVTTATGSSGSLNISGNSTVTLAAGTYNYTSLSISGNGRLSATGAVVIYVSGTVSIAGNGISTSSSKPPNMLIYSTGSSSVSLSGNGNLYAGIYAPNSAVSNSGNGALYGAVVSRTYAQSGNGAIHFDEALQNVGGSGNTSSLLSWQESGLTNQG